jgi:hypothetical protein
MRCAGRREHLHLGRENPVHMQQFERRTAPACLVWALLVSATCEWES